MEKYYTKSIMFIGFCIFVLGVYGFMQSSAIEATFKFFHAFDHVITGAVLMYCAYASQRLAQLGAQFMGVFYIPLITESFVSHGGVIEYHVLIHVVIAIVLLYVGFFWKFEQSVA